MPHITDDVHRMKDILSQADITVLDIRHTHRAISPREYPIVSKEYNADYCMRACTSEEITWDIRMTGNQVHQMIELADECNYYSKLAKTTNNALMQAKMITNRYQGQLGQLRATLNDHPELNEQWVEFMTLLKIAGLEADVLKLIT
jgi:hypothetical protein